MRGSEAYECNEVEQLSNGEVVQIVEDAARILDVSDRVDEWEAKGENCSHPNNHLDRDRLRHKFPKK